MGKGTIWDGGLKVPLIVRGPGIVPSTYSSVPVTGVDFLPTLVDLAGGMGPLPQGLEGTSFKSVLKNGGQLPAGVSSLSRAWGENGELFFHFPHYGPDIPIGESTPASAIRDGDYKLVRLYGENGNPNQDLLFNLAANPAESNDPNSPLNLASQMPEKVALLEAKLTRWLEGVDASLPYDVRTPVELTWKAEQAGKVIGDWRSVNNVDNYDREVWSPMAGTLPVAAGTVPSVVTAQHFQPGLSSKAFQFDGDDGIYHQFFHVSDARFPTTIDADHSATFETWVKFDDLGHEQLLFEAGSSTQGLSLTLGDANDDGSDNDLRFRVLGKAGNNLTLTAEIDKYADPTKDFIQIAAVISDKSTDRYLELYINGALAGRINGPAGATALDWDSFYQASLGGVSPNADSLGYTTPDTLGGAGGSGVLPFTGGKLKGQIAEFQFHNYALTASDLRNNYNSVLETVGFGLKTVSGATMVPSYRPSSVAINATESSYLQVIEERSDTLDQTLMVDALVTGPLSLNAGNQGSNSTLPIGTSFTSFLLNFDPTSNNSGVLESISGSVGFDQRIIGVIFDQGLLQMSDFELGSIGNYGNAGDRGLIFDGSDFLTISADRLALSFSLAIPGNEMLQFRVLTEQVPLLAADFNFDGVVDSDDLAQWQSSFGNSSGGDADNDGDTDGRDFLIWQREIGSPVGGFQQLYASDFDHSGTVDSGDLAVRQASFGINGAADADGDGDSDGKDFLVWQQSIVPV